MPRFAPTLGSPVPRPLVGRELSRSGDISRLLANSERGSGSADRPGQGSRERGVLCTRATDDAAQGARPTAYFCTRIEPRMRGGIGRKYVYVPGLCSAGVV